MRLVVEAVDKEKESVTRGVSEMGLNRERVDVIFSRIQEVDELAIQTSEASMQQTKHMNESTGMLGEVVDTVNDTLQSVDSTLVMMGKQRAQIGNLHRISRNLGRSSVELAAAIEQVGVARTLDGSGIDAAGIQRWLQAAIEGHGLDELDEQQHERRLNALYKERKDIEAIWSNRTDGSFIYSLPEAGLLNAKGRDWWKRASGGQSYRSEIYISAITKRPCLTISLPIRTASGMIVGVIGADLTIS